MMAYSSLQIKSVWTKQIYRCDTSVFSSIDIYVVKSVDNKNQIFRRL